jgi:hypothetical protein
LINFGDEVMAFGGENCLARKVPLVLFSTYTSYHQLLTGRPHLTYLTPYRYRTIRDGRLVGSSCFSLDFRSQCVIEIRELSKSRLSKIVFV